MENLKLSNPTVELVELNIPTFSFESEGLLKIKELGPTQELLDSVRLAPNGADQATFTVTVTNQNGQTIPNVAVTFSVQATYPLGWWRDIEQVKKRYGTSSGWQGKKLIGTLNTSVVSTDGNGKATVTYTASHIGGDDNVRCGEEIIIARIANGSTTTGTIFLGLTNLRVVNEVAGGLNFKTGVSARYAHPDLANFLEQLGNAIKSANWPRPLVLTEISSRWGGMIPPHAAHYYGLEIDCRPMSTDGNGTSAGNQQCPKAKNSAANYDRSRNKIVAKIFKDSGCTKFYFNDSEITESTCYAFHHNHMHIGWLSRALNLLQDNIADDINYEVF